MRVRTGGGVPCEQLQAGTQRMVLCLGTTCDAQVAEGAAEGARAREEEARASSRELAERARRAEALVAEYEADIGQVRAVSTTIKPP